MILVKQFLILIGYNFRSRFYRFFFRYLPNQTKLFGTQNNSFEKKKSLGVNS